MVGDSQRAVNALATGEDLPPVVPRIDVRTNVSGKTRAPGTVHVLPLTRDHEVHHPAQLAPVARSSCSPWR